MIVIDDSIAIPGLRIIQGNHGLFISMPTKRKPDGAITEAVHPTNRQTRAKIEDSVVLAEYQRLIEQSGRWVARQI